MFNFAIYFLINQNVLRNFSLTRSDVLMIEHDQPQLKPDKIKDAVTNKKKMYQMHNQRLQASNERSKVFNYTKVTLHILGLSLASRRWIRGSWYPTP